MPNQSVELREIGKFYLCCDPVQGRGTFTKRLNSIRRAFFVYTTLLRSWCARKINVALASPYPLSLLRFRFYGEMFTVQVGERKRAKCQYFFCRKLELQQLELQQLETFPASSIRCHTPSTSTRALCHLIASFQLLTLRYSWKSFNKYLRPLIHCCWLAEAAGTWIASDGIWDGWRIPYEWKCFIIADASWEITGSISTRSEHQKS